MLFPPPDISLSASLSSTPLLSPLPSPQSSPAYSPRSGSGSSSSDDPLWDCAGGTGTGLLESLPLARAMLEIIQQQPHQLVYTVVALLFWLIVTGSQAPPSAMSSSSTPG